MAEWKNRLMSRLSGKKTKEDDGEEKKTRKNVCFEKAATVYSDSIIVDAIPQQTAPCDVNGNHVKGKGSSVHVESHENHLTRQQVVHMLKHRFKDDFDDWQHRRDPKPVDICSEPSRSPKLSTRKRYGHVPKSPDVSHPTLPRKLDNKTGTIWLQCGEEIKQVLLPKETFTLGHIRKIFQDYFQSELKHYAFGADRGILLIKDPFTRAFKELRDIRHVLPGSHLKLLAPKKKPCRSPEHAQLSKSFTFDERRRSRSFDSEASDALSSVATGFTRARTGSYSFHGTTKTGYIVTPKRHVVTSTPKPKHSTMRTADANSPHMQQKGSGDRNIAHGNRPSSPCYGKSQPLIRPEMSPSRYNDFGSPPSQKVALTGIGSRMNNSEAKRPPRSPVEEQLDSLTDLLQEALRTDDISDVTCTSYHNSTASVDVPPKPTYLSSGKTKIRSASDSGTESLISETGGRTSVEARRKPPPPRRTSSKEAAKTLSPQRQNEPPENKLDSPAESPRKSIVRPRVWVDTSSRARDDSIKVTSAYLKKDVKQLRIQLEELRNQHEYNSHIFHSMIVKTGTRITEAIEALMPVNSDIQAKNVYMQRQKLSDDENAYQRRSDNAEKIMRRLENEIEMLREAAVNYKSLPNQSELNDVHSSIANLNTAIASLKSDFEALSRDARCIMAEEKHSLFEEERFFKEEPSRLDQLGSRCHHAVGILFKLQKLTSTQQNAIEIGRNENTSSPVKSPLKETDTIKWPGSYRRSPGVTQIPHKTKVEYGGTTTTVDYNQNTITQLNAVKTKVRFNDTVDNVSYHQ